MTNKFGDVVGRVTPCAPFGKLSADRGAHGVTRPTRALHDVTKLICRGTSTTAERRSTAEGGQAGELAFLWLVVPFCSKAFEFMDSLIADSFIHTVSLAAIEFVFKRTAEERIVSLFRPIVFPSAAGQFGNFFGFGQQVRAFRFQFGCAFS